MKDSSSSGLDSQTTQTRADEPAEEMLLSQSDSIMIADCLQIPELAPEVERAVWQIEKEIKSRRKLEDEKVEPGSAKENSESSR